jgi:hypothetical protein
MNGLRIIGIDNTQVNWIYKGQHGVSAVTGGTVQAALLLNEDFDLAPPIGAEIIQECQTRVDQDAGTYTGPARFQVKVQQDTGTYNYYSVLAHNVNAAIMLAFALDGGIRPQVGEVTRIEPGHLELAKEYCEIVE